MFEIGYEARVFFAVILNHLALHLIGDTGGGKGGHPQYGGYILPKMHENKKITNLTSH